MTLIGRLPEVTRGRAIEALRALYAPIDRPVTFDAISICEQTDRGESFRVRRRFAFGR